MANGTEYQKTNVRVQADVNEQLRGMVGALIPPKHDLDVVGKGLELGGIAHPYVSLANWIWKMVQEAKEAEAAYKNALKAVRDRNKIEESLSFESLEEAQLALQEINRFLAGAPVNIEELEKKKRQLTLDIASLEGYAKTALTPQMSEVEAKLEEFRKTQIAYEVIKPRLEKDQARLMEQEKMEERFTTLEQQVGKIDELLAKVAEMEAKIDQISERLNDFSQVEPQAGEQEVALNGQMANVEEAIAAVAKPTGLKDQIEVVNQFYESSETAVGNLDRRVESFVADSRQSFGTFQDVVQRVMANVEGLFGKSVGSIVSRWFNAIQQMVMGAKTGGQGILQGILGGLFGVFPGGPIGTPPFVASRPDFLWTVPLSPGGSGSAEIPTARGGAAEQVQRALQTLIYGGGSRLAALRSLGLAGADIGGNFLLEIARRAGGPVKGALGGALVGLTTGVAMAGGFGAAFVGSLAGPVGLAVGAATGLILGIIGRGRAKNQAARMEEEVIREGLKIAEQFRRFEIEYEPARAQLEALKAQGVETLLGSRLGRAGRRGAENLARNMDVQIRALENLQRQREQRLGIVQGFALPEFQSGGVVSAMRSMRAITSARGGILAMLHPGEFVLRKEAVEAVGATLLARFNRSPHSTPVDLPGGKLPNRR